MTSPQRPNATRTFVGACVFSGMAILAGCDGGDAPVVTPTETKQAQTNEMDARQKAYGNAGMPGLDKKAKGTPKEAPAPKAD